MKKSKFRDSQILSIIKQNGALFPENSGMTEAFLNTFKWDYVWLGDLSSEKSVMEQFPKWFADYNRLLRKIHFYL